MFFYLTKILTAITLPPFNIAVIWILTLILKRLHYKKMSCFFTILGIAMLYLFSIPFMATLLNNSLMDEYKLNLQDYQQAQAIVVLGGGLRDSTELYGNITVTNNELERMRYAAFLYKETGLPILATGRSPNGNSEAKAIAKEFQQFFDVPTRWEENEAKTTKENAFYTKQMLEKEGIHKIILVTQNWHMKRAKMLFEQQGFEVLPAGVGYGKTPWEYISFMYFVPQSGAMDNMMQLLKEWLGYWKER